MTEERSQEWTPLVEVIRREMLARFSDKLSMEEIASCAYAVAARDGQGGTGMVEEERSRFEKWWAVYEEQYDVPSMARKWIADCVWQARAALEDRQEAAPTQDFKYDPECEICGDSEYWHFRTLVGRHADGHKFKASGVPSGATPTKENAPSAQKLAEEYCADMIKTLQANVSAEREKQSAPAPEVQGTPTNENEPIWRKCELCGRENSLETWAKYLGKCPSCHGLHDRDSTVGTPQKETPRFRIYNPGGENHGQLIEPTPHPAHETVPEGVQGTPTIEESIKAQLAEIAAHPASGLFQQNAPVGTPQKETPPAKCPYCDFNEGLGHAKFCRNYQVTRGSSMPYGADAQNFGVVPEGVQGKEPQTPDFTCPECDSNCCITAGGSKLVCYHCYLAKAAPVPEGVQGKETRCPQCNSDKRWVRNITAIPVDGAETNSECCHPWHDTGTSPKYEPLDGATCDARARDFHARFSPISLQELQAFQSYERNDAFGSGVTSGEAAGRRSAITEMQGRAKENGVIASSESNSRYLEVDDVIAWCAELQEKMKP